MAFTRREFAKISGGALAGIAASRHLSAVRKPLPLGIQLYTVRDMMAKDLDGTLHQVAAAGFQEVEAAGYFGKTATQFKQAVDNAGLRCVSVHHPLSDLLTKGEELIEYVHDLGASYLICSSPRTKDPSAKEMSLDDWKWDADQFNQLGEKTKKVGIHFGYHNHVGEFKKLDGEIPYDELLSTTDPKLVTMEMDCGWVAAAGLRPADYLKQYPNRFSLLHVKDMVLGEGKPHSTELGHGSIDYAAVYAAAGNVKHAFYEQEEFGIPAMEALKISADYLKKL